VDGRINVLAVEGQTPQRVEKSAHENRCLLAKNVVGSTSSDDKLQKAFSIQKRVSLSPLFCLYEYMRVALTFTISPAHHKGIFGGEHKGGSLPLEPILLLEVAQKVALKLPGRVNHMNLYRQKREGVTKSIWKSCPSLVTITAFDKPP